MVKMADLSKIEQKMLLGMEGPTFESRPWVDGPPLNRRRIAMITTAGLHKRTDPPFQMGQPDFYRVLPAGTRGKEIVMSHGAASFDRSGYQRDLNVVFPLDRLQELANEGFIGSVADYHYSFGTPLTLQESETAAKKLSDLFKEDQVNAVLVFPV
jgi:D-proline reductase (dithiol) PrdB